MANKLKFHVGNVATFLKLDDGNGWGYGWCYGWSNSNGDGWGYGWSYGESEGYYKVKGRQLVSNDEET